MTVTAKFLPGKSFYDRGQFPIYLLQTYDIEEPIVPILYQKELIGRRMLIISAGATRYYCLNLYSRELCKLKDEYATVKDFMESQFWYDGIYSVLEAVPPREIITRAFRVEQLALGRRSKEIRASTDARKQEGGET